MHRSEQEASAYSLWGGLLRHFCLCQLCGGCTAISYPNHAGLLCCSAATVWLGSHLCTSPAAAVLTLASPQRQHPSQSEMLFMHT